MDCGSGYNVVTVDPQDGSYGGMFSKLLMRELPDVSHRGVGHVRSLTIHGEIALQAGLGICAFPVRSAVVPS